ncbi:hypothetical protein EYF80_021817 [Liparis tanakae]|uniref:Uncharacterized protein n=1 Tax=Liparis tanakae TaxID=230148 RepID=A0A4Z2HRT4_9TELE|nr:hypothetical protein EYF80_021817 [Liparis tanakae]
MEGVVWGRERGGSRPIAITKTSECCSLEKHLDWFSKTIRKQERVSSDPWSSSLAPADLTMSKPRRSLQLSAVALESLVVEYL